MHYSCETFLAVNIVVLTDTVRRPMYAVMSIAHSHLRYKIYAHVKKIA